MSSRQRAVHDLQVEQSDEFMHAAAAGRGVPSGPTAHSSGRRQQQPGEAQEAPFSDLSVHRGPRLMQMAVLERFRGGLAVSPGDPRRVVGAPRACGSAGPALGERAARWVP